MALINRIGRLFRADVHAVLDRIEEPAEMLRQAIREMEAELAAAERRLKLSAREQERLAERRAELGARLEELDAELDLCFGSDKPDLARALVRKKVEAGKLLKRVEAKLAATDRSRTEARREFDAQQSALESLRQKAEIFADTPPHREDEGAAEAAWAARDLEVSDEEVEVAWLREQQARTSS